MKNKKIALGLVLGAAVPAFFGAAAAKAEQPWSLEVAAGVQYDGNVNVEQLDILTSESDFAGLFEASAAYELSGSAGSLEVGYDFSQRLYEDLDQFDLQSHAFSAGAKTKLGKAKLGVDYSYHIIRLGGDPFLNMHVVTPSIAGFVSNGIYLRGYYSFYDKNFEVANNRDADSHSFGLTAFRFFMNSKGYFNAGVRYDVEDTVDPILDYDGYLLDAKLQLPLSIVGRDAKARLGYSYRKRDYDNITPALGERRRENRSVVRAELETPLVGGLSLESEYRYTNRNSNFASTDYNEHFAAAMLRYRF